LNFSLPRNACGFRILDYYFATYLDFWGALRGGAPEVGRKIIAIKPVSKTFIEQLQFNNHYLQEFSILTFAPNSRVA